MRILTRISNGRLLVAIKTPYAQCQLNHGHENSENRPPFINYGGRYGDKQHGEKRTFNSLAIHVRSLQKRESFYRMDENFYF